MSTVNPKPLVLESVNELKQWRNSFTHADLGFVPTMGALHQGHEALMSQAAQAHKSSLLSIFVNPAQFGPQEDLAQYPRTFEADLELARRCGITAVFAPQPQDFYPAGFSTQVEETQLSKPLCGAFRPGHFKGVTTVVLKLFNLVRPHTAYFGLKDAQQFLVIRKMVQDLQLHVRLQGVATVRDPDGLALSSRNRYLSPQQRALAPLLQQHLKCVAHDVVERKTSWLHSLEKAREDLATQGFQVQYLDLLQVPDLSPWPLEGLPPSAPGLLAVAAYLGTTRLIDNVWLGDCKPWTQCS